MIEQAADSTTVLFVRHGHTAAVGHRLAGRLPGVHLSDSGRDQARRIVTRLEPYELAGIYASPLERAVETAEPLAAARGLPIRTCAGLDEIDFGEWSGLTFEALDRLPAWRRFNSARGTADVPGGEPAPAAQARAIRAIEAIAARHRGAAVAAFSHADVIRSVLLHYSARALDRIEEITILPASIAALRIGPAGGSVVSIDHEAALRADGKW